MPSLRLTEAPAAGLPDVTMLALNGTLDIASLPQLESSLTRLHAAGRVKVILDLAGLEYISSSGLGSFLGTLDPFRKAGGDLVFIRLSERLQKIFKVVGFQRLLTLLPDEAAALDHFRTDKPSLTQFLMTPATVTPHSGEGFEMEILAADARGMAWEAFNGEAVLRPSTGIVSPAKIGPFQAGVWRGKVALTGPGQVTLRAVHGDVGGESVYDVQETKPAAVLPVTIACPGCGLATEIRAFNVYRCRDCDEIYFVDKWAHAISLKAGQRGAPPPPKVVSLAFPSDVNLLAPVRSFLSTMLKEHGYGADLINDLELAVDEAVTNVVEHAYQYDTRKSVHIELQMDKSQVKVLVRDQGQAYNPLNNGVVDLDKHIEERRTGGLGMHLIQSVMDEVDYKRESDSNILVLTKKAGPA